MLRQLHSSSPCRRQAIAHSKTRVTVVVGLLTRETSNYTVVQLLQHDKSTSDPRSDPSDNSRTVDGFVRSLRKQKRVAFATISDGSTVSALQAVLTPEQAKELSVGSAVKITGKWLPSPAGKEQSHELHAHTVRAMGNNDSATYPIQKKYHTPEYLRTLPHLRSRLPINSLLLRLRSQLIRDSTNFFHDRQFIQTHPPIITSSDCEGAGEVFTVTVDSESETKGITKLESTKERFFRSPKYLTVSTQLHLEALAQSVGKVWTLSPIFRAEKSDTPRHLSEFYMLEAEFCFVEDVNDVMDVVESLLRDISSRLQHSTLSEQLMSAWSSRPQDQDSGMTQDNLATRWRGLNGDRWPRISYKDAITFLQEATSRQHIHFDFPPTLGSGLQAEHEKYLAEAVGKGSPIFVTDYPRDIKAFYMASSSLSDASLQTVACFDLLVPELCEIAGGSMREHRLDLLLKAMDDHGLLDRANLGPDLSSGPTNFQCVSQDLAQGVPPGLEWYVDLRRYGSVPHGGFGLGFDRLLSYLSGVSSIRDVRPTNDLTTLAGQLTSRPGGLMDSPAGIPNPIEEEFDYESLPPNFSLASNMLAGAFAGIAEHSVMYPIDLLKTRMQVVNPSPTAVYSGISNAMVTITRVEGFRTLWRGVSSVVVGAGPAHAVYFATYEWVKHAMGGNSGLKTDHHPLAAAVSGASATIASDALMNPFDVIKQRMQLQNSAYRTMAHCARTVFKTEGVRAFYVSYPTTLCMTVPFTALQFVAYESASKFLNPTGEYSPGTHILAGGVAGGFAAALTTPLDVIKTLLQTRGTARDMELRNVNGLVEAAKIIRSRNGYRGFFRGLKPRIVTTVPSTAICWQVNKSNIVEERVLTAMSRSAYEMAKAFFIARNNEV
ncbi:hypothetical protein FKW77_000910 [Venturia effusa]|uniref:asparagine--tRNA ligase n=1 Tax=Venturia effusa TaxID=50376 RepID=A0A517L6M4_9PEZI|nr:hypothetical protein FKW77_000910 [Venturia effusa]